MHSLIGNDIDNGVLGNGMGMMEINCIASWTIEFMHILLSNLCNDKIGYRVSMKRNPGYAAVIASRGRLPPAQGTLLSLSPSPSDSS